MNSFFLALQFLTRLPVSYKTNFNREEAGKSLIWFPLISGFIGLIVGYIQSVIFPIGPGFSGFVSLIVLYLLNGGLHLDGLADTADGFLSYRDQEEILRIMHDSTIGTYGVVALVFLFLGEYSVFSSTPIGAMNMAILMTSARMGVLFSIHFFPSASSSKLGEFFKGKGNSKVYGLQWIVFLAFIFIFSEPGMLVYPVLAIIFAYGFSRLSVRKIGGVSGDIYGAVMELSFLLLLLIYGVFTA